MRKERINEIWGVLFLLLGLFTLAALAFFEPGDIPFYTSTVNVPVQNYTGVIGAWLAFGLLITFGVSAIIIPLLFLLWSSCFFLQRVPEKKLFKFFGLSIALFSTATLVAICVSSELQLERAGAVGYLAGRFLLQYFGFLGSFILASSCLLLSLLLATDFLIYPMVKSAFERMRETVEELREEVDTVRDAGTRVLKKVKEREEKQGRGRKEKAPLVPTMPDVTLKVKKYRPGEQEAPEKEIENEKKAKETAKTPPAKTEKPAPSLPAAAQAGAKNGDETAARHEGVIGSKNPEEAETWQFPPTDLLQKPHAVEIKSDDLQPNSRLIEATLADFGIEVKVTEVEQGPVITRYELLPAPGVKVGSITSLSDDLALALKATSIRIIAPIPGKAAVGIEVPNSVTSMVFVRELVETGKFRAKKLTLPLVLGKDTSGRPLIVDLVSMPHILIAGTTGSGKTVCINSIIAGLLYYASPEDIKMVMVDPKMVELAVYNKIPHMLAPVVTDAKKASHTLNWVISEMENRYKLFATVGVRNITSFNERPLSDEAREELEQAGDSENVVPARIPYIIVVIDELADLMMVAADKVETAIARLAQLARAVGIHLILATQRPSVDVITGVIKANFPARISFKVASKVDSRTVLDAIGADKLIGRGDMLFQQPGDAKPIRGQACLITDQEINNIVKFVTDQRKPDYHPDLAAAQSGRAGAGGVMDKDELFDEAVAVVLETGQASTSNLQRRLRLGYTRAARIIDQMEAEGIIGPGQGAKPRDILIDRREPETIEIESE